jgi:hypothetical protein
MSLEVLLPGRAVFYPDSAAITAKEIRKKFNSWNAGEEVSSCMEAVGFVTPIEAEEVFLISKRIGQRSYGRVRDETSSFWGDTRALGSVVMQIALRDMQRGGLHGDLKLDVLAGHYEERHRELLHTDGYSERPSIRWLVAQGAGTTVGTSGHVSKADTLFVGDLSYDMPVGPGRQLELVEFPVGTAQRFMNVADIHAGPKIEGARMLASATLYLDR